MVKIKLVLFDSPEQKQLIKLRQKVLRTPLGLRFSKEELQAEQNQLNIVAITDNIVIGGMLLVKEDHKIKMRQVCVDPNFQSHGIGKKLLDFANIFAKENNFNAIYCHARLTAQNFYLTNGYQIISDQFLEVGLPHYKMELRIN